MRSVFLISVFTAVVTLAAPTPKNDVVPNSHIVVFRDGAGADSFKAWLDKEVPKGRRKPLKSLRVAGDFHAVSGTFDGRIADLAKKRPEVAFVAPNKIHHIFGKQVEAPSWGLPRISAIERGKTTYLYPDLAGTGVTVYVVDTGVRVSHSQFEGRARWGFSAIPGIKEDDNGHGTHVAATIGGKDYGVAKKVELVAVKVCTGQGQCTTEDIIAGIQFVARDARGKKAITNMSLGGGSDDALDYAVTSAINAGITFVVAAGNDHANACEFSPARVPSAITVGASTISDTEATFSNYGSCVDVYAPGRDITSAWHTDDGAVKTISGTSMASPHTAGVSALLAASGDFSPAQIARIIGDTATLNALSDITYGSPNALLFNGGESSSFTREKSKKLPAEEPGSVEPTAAPTVEPSANPTAEPTDEPTSTTTATTTTTAELTDEPTRKPTALPTPESQARRMSV